MPYTASKEGRLLHVILLGPVAPGSQAYIDNLPGSPPPVAVAISLLVGGLDAKDALSSACQSRPVRLGFDRLPPPSESRFRAHDTPSLDNFGVTDQGVSVVGPA